MAQIYTKVFTIPESSSPKNISNKHIEREENITDNEWFNVLIVEDPAKCTKIGRRLV
ncbi:MAG: hypothetical protein ABI237_11255 [Ginsengibacter sp.]